MIKPFAVAPLLSGLPNPFPSPGELRAALSGGTRRTREIFVRLWLTEGTPAAFQHCPAIYEELRGWLGWRLEVHPKAINLVGSARIGFSLAPPPNFGTPFGEGSDFDFSAISALLFERLVKISQLFADDYNNGDIQPRNDRERKYWDANLEFSARNIQLGFLDSSKIPTLDRYPFVQKINSDMWFLLKKLEATPGAPRPERASIRVYRDWPSCIDRVSLNLYTALRKA
ncbi:hypothetical protein JYU08_00445 [bacterium AH-315-B06]|nr:hypothetical protein [bacterium AH-315-B06]